VHSPQAFMSTPASSAAYLAATTGLLFLPRVGAFPAPLIPEGLFRAEEARIDALTEPWLKANQDREDARLKLETELQTFIISRARYEAEFWEKCVGLLDVHRQKAEIELAKAQDKTLEDLVARKALADAESAEYERGVSMTSLKLKAEADAARAVVEVASTKDQRREGGERMIILGTEPKPVDEALIDVADAQKGKFDVGREKTAAAINRAKAQTKPTDVPAAAVKNAPPPQEKAEHWVKQLGELKPCNGGYDWEHRPDKGGFGCKAPNSRHFMTYDQARACIETYNASATESGE